MRAAGGAGMRASPAHVPGNDRRRRDQRVARFDKPYCFVVGCIDAVRPTRGFKTDLHQGGSFT
jgi:hypothetical protein